MKRLLFPRIYSSLKLYKISAIGIFSELLRNANTSHSVRAFNDMLDFPNENIRMEEISNDRIRYS